MIGRGQGLRRLSNKPGRRRACDPAGGGLLVTVSLETMKIVHSLPALDIREAVTQ